MGTEIAGARISVILVTCNRLQLLEKCVENVIARTSAHTNEIIVWDNASSDGTGEFLQSLEDPRIRVMRHAENIGTNAFARAFALANGDYLIELDDDVIDAPPNWDESLLDAFRRIPKMGFLAANVIDDGKSVAADIMYRRDKHLYSPYEDNGVNLLRGPVGGWCTMTSREVYDAAGGFRESKEFKFWHEDGLYAAAVGRAGFDAAILADLKVFHASGPAYSKDVSVAVEKAKYYTARDRRRRRKERIKQFLDAIPPIRALNRRFHWYTFMGERLQNKRNYDQEWTYWKGE